LLRGKQLLRKVYACYHWNFQSLQFEHEFYKDYISKKKIIVRIYLIYFSFDLFSKTVKDGFFSNKSICVVIDFADAAASASFPSAMESLKLLILHRRSKFKHIYIKLKCCLIYRFVENHYVHYTILSCSASFLDLLWLSSRLFGTTYAFVLGTSSFEFSVT